MLVLSRGRNDKVTFPTLGITIEILRVVGNKVRLGIDAPRDITVLRDELVGSDLANAPAAGGQTGDDRLTHSMRNRFQKATLGLRLLQRMLEAGQADAAEPTIFKIFSELKSLEEELSGAPKASTAPATGERGLRALVVEDDANESQLLAGYLRLSGFVVDTAMDGSQAMVHLSAHARPDIMLLDMGMPRFNGSQTVRAVREKPEYQDLRIFAVTGTQRGASGIPIGPDGVNRWFRKPIDPEEVVGAIREELLAETAEA